MGEARRLARGHARDRAVLGIPVAVADQGPVLVPDPDAVGVLVPGQHGVAEHQRRRARTAQQRRALGPTDGEHEVRVGRGGHRLGEGHRDLDGLAHPVGVRRRPARRGQQRRRRHRHRADRTRAVHLVAGLHAAPGMGEVRLHGRRDARDRAGLGVRVAVADQGLVLGPDPDAVVVAVRGQHGVAEHQRRRARTAQQRRALGPIDGQLEVRVGRGGHRLVEGHRDLDRLAGAVGVRRRPARRGQQRRRRHRHAGDRRRRRRPRHRHRVVLGRAVLGRHPHGDRVRAHRKRHLVAGHPGVRVVERRVVPVQIFERRPGIGRRRRRHRHLGDVVRHHRGVGGGARYEGHQVRAAGGHRQRAQRRVRRGRRAAHHRALDGDAQRLAGEGGERCPR